MSLTNSVISKINQIIENKTQNNLCFSSGEIVAEIRQQNPSLVFSAKQVGQYISQMYFNHEIIYPYVGTPGYYATRILRITLGKGRTPAGLEVYVYGPNDSEAQNHDFEVDVPTPTGSRPTTTMSVVARGQKTFTVPVQSTNFSQINPTNVPVDSGLVAVVHKDGRLCIPPQAFDRLASVNGRTLNSGDFVYIGVGNHTGTNGEAFDHLTISVSGIFGDPSFVLSNEGKRVRVAATSPKLNLPAFVPGTKYPLLWNSDNNLQINL